MSNVKARLKTLRTDSDIIQLVVNGNTNAFRHLVERYEGRVASLCMNMLKDPNLAEEVGQETFVRLFNSLQSFKGKSALGTYITRIAIKLCLKTKTGQQHRKAVYGNPERRHSGTSYRR